MSRLISKGPSEWHPVCYRSTKPLCLPAELGPGWGGGSSCWAEHSPAHAWAGPGSELSLWGSLGTPQGARQPPLLPNTACRPKSPSWGLAGNCFSMCRRRWCLWMPEAGAAEIITLSIYVGSAESCRTPPMEPTSDLDHTDTASNCCRLLGTWDHLTQGLHSMGLWADSCLQPVFINSFIGT